MGINLKNSKPPDLLFLKSKKKITKNQNRGEFTDFPPASTTTVCSSNYLKGEKAKNGEFFTLAILPKNLVQTNSSDGSLS